MPAAACRPTVLRITAPRFQGAVDLVDGFVRMASPVLRFMTRWTCAEVGRYAHAHGWSVEVIQQEWDDA